MVKKLFVLFLLLSCGFTFASSLDDVLNAQTRSLNLGNIYGGVGTAAGVANTVSNVKTNASLRKRLDTETALIRYQASKDGIDLRDSTDVMREHNALLLKSRYYLIQAKKQAKFENDEEVLNLIKKCWKWYSVESAIFAAQKVIELKESRKKKTTKL